MLRAVEGPTGMHGAIRKINIINFDGFRPLDTILANVIDVSHDILQQVLRDNSIKIQLFTEVDMTKGDVTDTFYFQSPIPQRIINTTDIDTMLNLSAYSIMDLMSEVNHNGSEWVYDNTKKVYILIYRNLINGGGSFIKTLSNLSRFCVNIDNTVTTKTGLKRNTKANMDCIKWTITASFYPVEKNSS